MHKATMNYVHIIVRLLKKSGKPYTEIALDSGVSYGKVIRISNYDHDSVSMEVIRKLEEYALSVLSTKS